MPRLKLDIFSSPTASDNPVVDNIAQVDGLAAETSPIVRDSAPPLKHASSGNASPKFVPVGFHSQHLQVLDEAVMRLRRQGYWQASKSGLIRCLIEHHKEDLDVLWKDQRNKHDQSGLQESSQ
jgi:hypothetical protein